MEIDYYTLPNLAGVDGFSSVPLIILDYIWSDLPGYKPRFIKDAVPRNKRIMVGVENPFQREIEPFESVKVDVFKF